MKSKLLYIFCMCLVILLCGCEKKETNTRAMTSYTSVYPVEYILDNLYGEKIAISSIYPEGVDFKDKNNELTEKQLNDYSKQDLFIYNNTIEKEKDYAVLMINKNKKLKIIDASLGMTYDNSVEETWLDPTNYLMMASNIKKGLFEYVEEKVEIKKIEENYAKLKLTLTDIDAELKQAADNNSANILIVSSDVFKFLEKYGFTVISLEENENLTDKTIADVKKILSNKMANYIFLKDNEKENQTIKKLKEEYKIETLSLNSISTLSQKDRIDKKDYAIIMMENIKNIKLEVND